MMIPTLLQENPDDAINGVAAAIADAAWRLMILASLTGFIGVRLILHDLDAALALAGICFVGLVSKALYLRWKLGSVYARARIMPPASWRGDLLQAAFVMVFWLLPDFVDRHLTSWSFVGAAVCGGGLILMWWSRSTEAANGSRAAR